MSGMASSHGHDRKTLLPRKIYAGFSAVFILLALLTACSSDSDKPAEEAKPEVKGPELMTARSAFQKLYIAARGWQPDAKPYRLESSVTSDGNGQDGKWAIWRGSFASAAQRSEKAYTWSGSAADGAPVARRQPQRRRQLQRLECLHAGV